MELQKIKHVLIKKKAICKECNAAKVKCEYCFSIISFSGLKGHMKNFHKQVDLFRGVYSVNDLEPINKNPLANLLNLIQ